MDRSPIRLRCARLSKDGSCPLISPSLVYAAPFLGLLLARPAAGQEQRVIVLQAQWDTVAVSISASSNDGVTMRVGTPTQSIAVVPAPTALRAWADTAMAAGNFALAIPPSGEVTADLGGIANADGSGARLVRAASASATRYTLTLQAHDGTSSLSVALSDSLTKVFLGAARNAAVMLAAMAGDKCAAAITTAIAQRGAPRARERGSSGATELYEQLVWTGGSSTTIRYSWGTRRPGCIITRS